MGLRLAWAGVSRLRFPDLEDVIKRKTTSRERSNIGVGPSLSKHADADIGWIRFATSGHGALVQDEPFFAGNPHSIARIINMSAIAQQAQVAKTVAVSTGKVANAKSMMVWRPHGNKYVSRDSRLATFFHLDRTRERVGSSRGNPSVGRAMRGPGRGARNKRSERCVAVKM